MNSSLMLTLISISKSLQSNMPRIVSLPPPTQVSEGEEFSHTFEVVDPDAGDEVTLL